MDDSCSPTTGLLSPPESASSDDPGVTPAPSATNTNQKALQTGAYLEDLSRAVLDITLNQKDNSHPTIVKHMAASFRNKHDALPRASTRDDHHENLQEHLAAQPDFHVNILNSSSDVDESRGRATVYLWYEISGVEMGFEREAVAVLSLERRAGLWQIIKHTGMRGPSGFS